MSDRLCLCGCNEPATGRYAVKRGHGSRVPWDDRPGNRKEINERMRQERLAHIAIPKARPKRRLCLRCDRPFRSRGPENRLCKSCGKGLAVQPTTIEARCLPWSAMRAPREL